MERDLSSRFAVARGSARGDVEDSRGRLGVDDDVAAQPLGPAATGCGWDGAIFALAAHLEDPSADLKTGQFAGWETSAEAAEFTRDTAAAWAAAEFQVAQSMRCHLRDERGLDKDRCYCAAYWRQERG